MNTLRNIDTLLLKHPLVKGLTGRQRLTIYNEVLSEIFISNNEPVILNDLGEDYIYKFAYYPHVDLNLSALRDIDDLINTNAFLSVLEESDRVLIYKMALEEIRSWRTNQADQEYQFNTIKKSPMEKSINYEPAVELSVGLLNITNNPIYYEPTITVDISLLAMKDSTFSYNPSLQVSAELLTNNPLYLNLIPSCEVVMGLKGIGNIADYTPELNVEMGLLTPIGDLDINYVPELSVMILVSLDAYNSLNETNYTPTLSVELNIT